MYMKHKNSQKRIYGDYCYFITCDVKYKIKFFENNLLCELWIKSLSLCKLKHEFRLFAFCLNHEHFHLLLKPNNVIGNYSDIMMFLKRHFTRNANLILGYNEHDLNKLIERDVGKPRIKQGENSTEGDVDKSRIRKIQREKWQIEMDEYLINLRKKFLNIYGKNHNISKFQWQKSFHDHVIRNQKDFDNHWNYTMYNFKKHGLPTDWQYTGLRYPDLIDDVNE